MIHDDEKNLKNRSRPPIVAENTFENPSAHYIKMSRKKNGSPASQVCGRVRIPGTGLRSGTERDEKCDKRNCTGPHKSAVRKPYVAFVMGHNVYVICSLCEFIMFDGVRSAESTYGVGNAICDFGRLWSRFNEWVRFVMLKESFISGK